MMNERPERLNYTVKLWHDIQMHGHKVNPELNHSS